MAPDWVKRSGVSYPPAPVKCLPWESYKFPGTPSCPAYKWLQQPKNCPLKEDAGRSWKKQRLGRENKNWPKGFRGIWVEESGVMSSTHLNFLLRKYPFSIPVGPISQDQVFSTLTLLMFGAGGFFVIWGFAVHCRLFNRIPSCNSLPMPQNISRQYQMSTEGNPPPSAIENHRSRWSAFPGQRMDVWPRLSHPGLSL